MNAEQEEHLQQIKEQFEMLVDRKYRRGQVEHGGDLFEKDYNWLINNALDEAVDLVVYLLTLKARLDG